MFVKCLTSFNVQWTSSPGQDCLVPEKSVYHPEWVKRIKKPLDERMSSEGQHHRCKIGVPFFSVLRISFFLTVGPLVDGSRVGAVVLELGIYEGHRLMNLTLIPRLLPVLVWYFYVDRSQQVRRVIDL